MIFEATKRAKQMAEQLFAKDSGMSIDDIHPAQQGTFTVKNPYNQEGYDRNEEHSLMKKVRVVSTFVFHLDT